MAARAQSKTAKPAGKAAAKSPSARKAPPTRRRTAAERPAAKPAGRKSAAKAAKPSPAKGTARAAAQRAPRQAFALGKLTQVALTVRDMDAAIAFYSNVLGLKLLARFDPAGFAFFSLGGGARLLLSAGESSATLYFAVDDLDSAVRTLKRRGVRFLRKPAMIHRDEAGEFGRKGAEEWMAFFHDPSENLLALVERR